MLIPLLFALAYPLCLAWAAQSDIVSMTIPNRLTLGLAIAFVPVGLLLGFDWSQWSVHLGIGFAALVIGMVLFALRAMGGGDAKLIAATALWLNGQGALAFVLYTALAGGALSLALMWARKNASQYAPALPSSLGRHLAAKGDIPYGVAICAGGLMAMLQSDILPLLHI